MTDPVVLEDRDGACVLRLNRGAANPINLDLVTRLSDHLERLRDEPGVRGVVLTGSEKFFSIGFDIPALYDLPRSAFRTFFRAFNRVSLDLYTFPRPTVAAVTGHATAGGCILALCCDYRLVAGGRKLMGLNEIKLGVPIPYLSDCILKQVVGVRHARTITEGGGFFPPEEALEMGLVDEIHDLEAVMPRAEERVRALGAEVPEAFDLIKRSRTDPVSDLVERNQEAWERSFLDCWYSDAARARLEEALEKFRA